MSQQTTLKFGPFTRSVTAVESHVAPPETMAAGSYNMLVDPIAGGAFKRSGFSVVGDTLNSSTKRAVAGILESAPGYVPCRLREFYSDALADGALGGSPTHSVLYRKEASSASWPTVDDGVFGTEYVRRPGTNTDLTKNYVLLSEFGVGTYPTGGGAHGAEIKYKVQPWWYESGEGGYSRGAFEFARRFATSGSWSTVDVGRWRFYGGLRSTPMKWDGGCNDVGGSTNSIRFRPTGPFRPLWTPTVTANGSAAGTTRSSGYPFLDGDTFYLSLMFKYEDGSFSLPTYPVLTTVGTIGGGNKYTGLTYSNVPYGGPDVAEVYLLRSNLQTRATATDALTINISDLRILGILHNNTQKSYLDVQGVDAGLLQNTDMVRWDLICPPRSRYLGTGDQRVIAGYTLPNQVAFELTCASMGVMTSSLYNQNLVESNAGISGNTSAVYRITESAIELGFYLAGSLVAGTSLSIDFATYDTLQKVVDRINSAGTFTYNAGTETAVWKAQLAPGADPTAASTGLCPTVWDVTGCATHTNTTLDGGTFTNIPIGYKVYGTGITAGTYIVSKQSATSVTLSAAATATASGLTMTCYADCGDEACVTTAGSKGWIRVFGTAITGFAYFKRSALVNYDKPAKGKVYFTIGNPGSASVGFTMAANAWSANNVNLGPDNAGQLMGIADVEGAAILAYRRKIGLFINERGSNTGEDFDYRIRPVNNSMGCVSPWSVGSAAGAAHYLTPVGLKAADKTRREVLLTGDVYQPVRGRGDLAYEVPQCVAAARADSPDCWMNVSSWGNRLVASFRTGAASYRFMVYDFSKGADQTGLDALANPEERKSYGWSSPCYLDQTNDEFGPRAMGAVAGSDGLRFYGAINDNSGTANGRVDQMFTGSTDNGVSIVGQIATKRYVAEPNTRISARNVTATHRVNYTGPVVAFSRLESGNTTATYAMASSGSNEVKNELLQLNQADRSPGNVAQLVFYDDAASVGGLVQTLDLAVEVLARSGG